MHRIRRVLGAALLSVFALGATSRVLQGQRPHFLDVSVFGRIGSTPTGGAGWPYGVVASVATGWTSCVSGRSACAIEYSFADVLTPMVLAPPFGRVPIGEGHYLVRHHALSLWGKQSFQGRSFVIRAAPTVLLTRAPVNPTPVEDGWVGGISVGVESGRFGSMLGVGQLRVVGDFTIGLVNPEPAPFSARIGLTWRSGPAVPTASSTRSAARAR